MKKKLEADNFYNLRNKILKILYIFLILLLVYFGTLIFKELKIIKIIFTIFNILSPLFIGIIFAWIFNPIVDFLQEKKVKRIYGTIIVYVLFFIFSLLLLNIIIPTIVKEINEFILMMPKILSSIDSWFTAIFKNFNKNSFIDFHALSLNIVKSIENFIVEISTDLPSKIFSLVKSTVSFFGVFVVGLVVGFFVLLDSDKFKNYLKRIIPIKHLKEVSTVLKDINASLFAFLKGTFVTSGIIFVLFASSFALIGVRSPFLLALISALTNVIPYVGPYVGAAPVLIVAFSQSFTIGIFTLIVILIIQTVEGEILHPYIMSKSMKLNPMTLLISLLVFKYFFGIVGMIIATPIVAILKILFLYCIKKLKRRNKNEEKTK